MAKIQADLPEEINKALKIHQLRYNFKYLPEALIDALKRFFADEDYDYLLMNVKKSPKQRKPNSQ